MAEVEPVGKYTDARFDDDRLLITSFHREIKISDN